jgi:GH25 family lysozyme M1 (1,4-beta-N-acetylmuramidase)
MARDRKPARHRTRALAVSVATLAVGGMALAETPASAASLPKGHDVSSHQKNVDWPKARAKGATFVYVKATESTNYRNPHFGQQYNGARDAGILRGAYHFALPDKSSGRTQAAHFVRNGGAWTADGWTLPPALDIEYNPYDKKHKCYRMTKAQLVGWIKSFSSEVKRLTGRRPVIYTTAHWWNTCTGGSGAFAPTTRCGWPATTRRTREHCPPDGRTGRSGSTTTAAACRVTRISSTGRRIS